MPRTSCRLGRRQFLGGTLSTLLLTTSQARGKEPGVKIERVDLFAVRYPTAGYFKFLKAGREAVIVKLTADNGVVGWGQSVPMPTWSYETLATSEIVLKDFFGPAIVGRDPLDLDGAQQALDDSLAGSFSTGMPIARAGIDLALHDLYGKLKGQSLAEMWGRKPADKLKLSWTVNARTVAEAEQLLASGWERGYRNFNIKVAPDPRFDAELARLVRKAAPDGFLWADANGGYDVETALAAAPKLRDAGVDVLEAPLKPNRLRGYQQLKKQGALPILMDEGIVSPVELEEFIHLKMLDGVAMKPSRCGGLASARAQIELLEREGLMWLGSGLTDPDVSLAASVALYAAYGLKKPAALNGPQFLAADILRQPLKIADGQIHAPRGPGLGIEVDEEKLQTLLERR